MPSTARKPPTEEIPPWLLDRYKKQQQATYLNARDTKGAQELFRSMDEVKKFKSLVRAGAPDHRLFATLPRPVNPQKRETATRDYLSWMRRRDHPEFEERVRCAVRNLNDYRRRMEDEKRTPFDESLKRAMVLAGFPEGQFRIHFKPVEQRPSFEPVAASRRAKPRNNPPGYKRVGE